MLTHFPLRVGVFFLAAATIGCSGAEAPQTTGNAGSASAAAAPAAASSSTPLDACALLSEAEIASAVGNLVLKGEHYAGTQVCNWDTKTRGDVTVLLQARPVIGPHAGPACAELRKGGGSGQPLDGVGDIAGWKFTKNPFFNSGDLEACTAKGYVNLSLNGKADEARLKQAAIAIARQVFQRM